MKRALPILGLLLGCVLAATEASAQPQTSSHTTGFMVRDHGREARFGSGSSAGVLPGDVAELLDENSNPVPGITFRVYKVWSGESYGKLEGPLTQSRLDQVKGSRGLLARFTRQPKNRSKCEPTFPAPIRDANRGAVLAGQAPAGYVVVPIDLRTPIENGDSYTSVAVGSSKMVLPKAKAYIVMMGSVVPSEVTSVEAGQATVDVSKTGLTPATIALAVAVNAKIAIAVGTCN